MVLPWKLHAYTLPLKIWICPIFKNRWSIQACRPREHTFPKEELDNDEDGDDADSSLEDNEYSDSEYEVADEEVEMDEGGKSDESEDQGNSHYAYLSACANLSLCLPFRALFRTDPLGLCIFQPGLGCIIFNSILLLL